MLGPLALPVVLDSEEDDDNGDDDVHDDDMEEDDTLVSIDLRPNTTQKRIEAKLPLPVWATQPTHEETRKEERV